MYTIEFHETSSGFCDIRDFMDALLSKAATSKDALIQYKQVARYIELLLLL